jgi:hypothetical protein
MMAREGAPSTWPPARGGNDAPYSVQQPSWRSVQFPACVDHRGRADKLGQLWVRVVHALDVTVDASACVPRIVVRQHVLAELYARAMVVAAAGSSASVSAGGLPPSQIGANSSTSVELVGYFEDDSSLPGGRAASMRSGALGPKLVFDEIAIDGGGSTGHNAVHMRVTLAGESDVFAPATATGATQVKVCYERLVARCKAASRSHPASLLQLHAFFHTTRRQSHQYHHHLQKHQRQHHHQRHQHQPHHVNDGARSGDTCSADIGLEGVGVGGCQMRVLAIFPSLCLRLSPLMPLRLFESPLAEVLSRAEHSDVEPRAGYLTMDRAR